MKIDYHFKHNMKKADAKDSGFLFLWENQFSIPMEFEPIK